jgi:hypothetical protein
VGIAAFQVALASVQLRIPLGISSPSRRESGEQAGRWGLCHAVEAPPGLSRSGAPCIARDCGERPIRRSDALRIGNLRHRRGTQGTVRTGRLLEPGAVKGEDQKHPHDEGGDQPDPDH